MLPEQENALTGGGDCFLHWHSEDRRPTQDFLHGLQAIARQREVTEPTTLTSTDDHVLVSGSITVTLPRAVPGAEYTVTNIGTGIVTVLVTGTDVVCGDTSVQLTVQWMSLTFKAVIDGWIII